VKILAIETATSICSAAILEDEQCISERSLNEPHIHAEKLLPMIDEALRECHLTAKSINIISVSIGPGSFTGLRIGLSTAKGLAYARNIPVIPVNTLEGLAWRAVNSIHKTRFDLILPMIDARRNEIFTAGYRISSMKLDELIPCQIIHIEKLFQLLEGFQKILLMGDGVDKFEKYCQQFLPDILYRFIIPPLNERLCSASSIGKVGLIKYKKREIANLSSLEPRYIKDFQTLVKTQHISIN